MIINIVLTTICHSLCTAASIIFFIAAVMSGWDTGETMFTFMFLGIIQGAVISSLGLLALRSRGFLSNWRSSLLATASYIAGTSFLTPVVLSPVLDSLYFIMALEAIFLSIGSLIPLTLVHPRPAPQKHRQDPDTPSGRDADPASTDPPRVGIIRNIVLTTTSHTIGVAVAARITLSIASSRGYDAARDYLLVIELIQGGVISSMGLLFLRLKGLLTSWSVAMRSTISYIIGTLVLTPVLLFEVMNVSLPVLAAEAAVLLPGSAVSLILVRPRRPSDDDPSRDRPPGPDDESAAARLPEGRT